MPKVVDISELPKSQALTIDGLLQNQGTVSSSIICDLDEDGNNDIILGNALQANNRGAVYVLWGTGSFNGLQFNATNQIVPPYGMSIFTNTTFQYVGASLACIDLNQDGHKELVVGAYSYSPAVSNTTGGAYVIYFNGTRIASNINVDTLTPSQGYIIPGTANTDQFGFDLDNIGDVNGDGFDDLAISAPYAAAGGKVYIIYSKPGLNAFDVNTLNTDASSGFLLQGTTGSSFGHSVRRAGDFNKDGYADFVVGAQRSNFAGINTGSAYVVFGNQTRATPTFANGLTNMIRFDGNPSGQQPRLGFSVSSAGDFDGDGYDDIIINAPFESSPTGLRSVGYSFIVFGKENFANITNVNALGSDAIKIYGREVYAGMGYSSSGGGDINGDGFDDIVTCEHYSFLRADGERDGACYVIFGNSVQRNTRFNINTLGDTQGYMLRDFSYGRLGHSSLWFNKDTDIDNDGYPDILVSAPLASPNGIRSAGTFHAISGRLPPIITTSTGATEFSQSAVPAIIDDGITVNDANNPTLATAEIWISEAFTNGDILGFVEQNGITGHYNSLTGVLTLAGVASVDAYQTALRSITYQNSAIDFSKRTISFKVSNGAKISEAASRPVALIPVDHLLTGSGEGLLCLNQEHSQMLFPQLTIIGGDELTLEQATVTIANATAEDSLSYDSDGSSVNGHYDATTGTLTLTGPATAKTFEALLRTAHYANSNNATTSIEKSVSLVVNFNEQMSNTVNSQINIITANDTPQVIHPIESFSVMADSEFSQFLSYPFDQPENQLTTSVVGAASTYFNSANNTLSGSLTEVGVNRFGFFGTDRCNQTGVSYFEINVTESTPIPTPTPTGSNTPAIIGGVIGGIAGLLCLGGLVFGGLWARKKRQPQEDASQTDVEMEPTTANNPV